MTDRTDAARSALPTVRLEFAEASVKGDVVFLPRYGPRHWGDTPRLSMPFTMWHGMGRPLFVDCTGTED